MVVGTTYIGSLADSLPDYRQGARLVRDNEGIVAQLCDKPDFGENEGISWNEISFDALSAQAVTELSDLDNNPQQISDSLLTVTPTIIGLYILITDRAKQRIAKGAVSKLGQLGQNAIEIKKDLDGITAIDGATTQLCGTGKTLSGGYIRAASKRITSNSTEPAMGEINCVLHGYQIKDLEDELVAGIGTYAIPEGATARVYFDNFQGRIGGANIYEDGNIPIDSTPDAKGGVFARMGLLLVQGRAARMETKREPGKGGGADGIYHYDEYAYGERSSGNWLYEIMCNATAPTS